MAWFDLDGFLASLPPRGVAEAHLPLYREAAEALLAKAGDGRYGASMLDEALAREALAGASERRLANLRRVGEAMIEYVGQGARTIAGPGVAAPPPPVAVAAVIAAPPLELDLAIDVPPRAARTTREPPAPAPPPRRGAATAPPRFDAPPRPGCMCRKREDVYIDDYWQEVGKVYLGVMCAAGGIAWRFAPRFVWLLVASGMLAVGALITGLTVGWRCESCRRWIAGRGLDADERAEARRRGLVFLGIAAALAVVFALSLRAARAAWHADQIPRIELGE